MTRGCGGFTHKHLIVTKKGLRKRGSVLYLPARIHLVIYIDYLVSAEGRPNESQLTSRHA
jgi:hypothetical protein